MQLGNSHSVFIVMGLCDETLKARIQRKGFNGDEARWVAARELCEGLGYLHGLQKAITHRDLKPSNVLFKGSCLKIADMGQSRILRMGETAVPTGSRGGTQGWMSPEEIRWCNGGSTRGVPFRARLSGDVHSAGSLLFYILSDGKHCFGPNAMRQQVNIVDGSPDFTPVVRRAKSANFCRDASSCHVAGGRWVVCRSLFTASFAWRRPTRSPSTWSRG